MNYYIALGILNPATLLVVYYFWARTTGILNILLTIIGAPIDLIVNQTWFTVMFFELPKELLLTQRVSRLKGSNRFAAWICRLLNYIKKGHCK